MMFEKTKGILARIISVAILSTGFANIGWAGTVDTAYLLEADARDASLARIEALLAEDEVAEQLQKFGVDPAMIDARLQGMTATELAALEGRIDENVAGGDALATIGVVFIIVLILEVLGVTDVFKKI